MVSTIPISRNFNPQDSERSGQLKKVENEGLEQILDENPCQTHF